MQHGLTAAQQAKLKALVTDSNGSLDDDHIVSMAKEFMAPVAVVRSFADYFCPKIPEQVVAEIPVKAKTVRVPKQTVAVEAVEAALDAQDPAGADTGATEESLEPALFGD